MNLCVLEGMGMDRLSKSCEARATRDSVCIFDSGTWKCRVAKKVMRACMVWCALGEWFVQLGHSLCWKKDVGVLFGDFWQSAQCLARMSGRVTGGEGRRWENGVRSAVASQVKQRVHR